MAQETGLPDVQLDGKDLYREEVFTDRRAGTVRRLVPVTVEGQTDATRATIYSGQTQLLTPGGVLPLAFFPDAVKLALEQAIEEAREYRRESASRIVVPDVAGGGPIPGGGKIKL
jgi:hypothetical protein